MLTILQALINLTQYFAILMKVAAKYVAGSILKMHNLELAVNEFCFGLYTIMFFVKQ